MTEERGRHPLSLVLRPWLLVVRLSALGDVIHTLPAVTALREHFEVDWILERPYADLVETVGEVKATPVSLKKWSLAAIRDARRAARGHQIAIDFQGLIKSSLVAFASDAKERYGFASEFIREKPAAWFINRKVKIDPATHVVEWNMQLANALRPGLSSRPLDFSRFTAVPPVSARGRVVLVPGAGKTEKLWPAERFRELARSIGERALAVWGPGERELAEQIGCEVAPPTNLRELAAVVRDAEVVIGGDTGPIHLAAAIGTRVIGLYGPTNPQRNGPYGQIENCVSTFASSKSMAAIEAGDVMRKL
jgi:lipopolysaccharide heptosyltransferase I